MFRVYLDELTYCSLQSFLGLGDVLVSSDTGTFTCTPKGCRIMAFWVTSRNSVVFILPTLVVQVLPMSSNSIQILTAGHTQPSNQSVVKVNALNESSPLPLILHPRHAVLHNTLAILTSVFLCAFSGWGMQRKGYVGVIGTSKLPCPGNV